MNTSHVFCLRTIPFLFGALGPYPGLDSVRMVHTSWVTSIFDAYGNVTTPAGTYASVRQLYKDQTKDSVFVYCSDLAGCVLPAGLGTLPYEWSLLSSLITGLLFSVDNPDTGTTYTYKWWANGEGVPVAEVETDGPAGTALSAKYKLGNNVLAMDGGSTNALCKDTCDGTASIIGLSGSGSYNYVWDTNTGNQTTATATGLCADTYTAFIVDGTDTSATVSFMVGEPTALSVTVIEDTITADTTGLLLSSVSGGTTPYNYLWNTTPAQLTATAVDLETGTYMLTVVDDNGCTVIATATVYLPIFDYPAASHIALYPNPVANSLFVETDLNHKGSFVAYNIVGKQVINMEISDKLTEINMADLANGMYVFQLIDGEGTVIQAGKFTVER